MKTKSNMTENREIKGIRVVCWKCGFEINVFDRTDLYEEAQSIGIIGCPNGCEKPSIQTFYFTS